MFKFLSRVLFVLVLLVAVFLLVSYVRHQSSLANEDQYFVPMGEMVEVNGHEMHVYTEGESELTLVFMSGGGTSSPVLDFKSLYSELSDDYQIAVVEKAGYGFSEVSGETPRDIDTILDETRLALLQAGIEGPYVLIPHSMSGLEALYWADNYPTEVHAIVGLDMALPEIYEDYPINIPLINLSSLLARIGVTRWFPQLADSEAVKYGTLSEEEQALARIVFYRRTATADMLNEVKAAKANANVVKDSGFVQVPMLLFSSNGEGTGYEPTQWEKAQADFAATSEDIKHIHLDSPHYIHNHDYQLIAEEILNYLPTLSHIN